MSGYAAGFSLQLPDELDFSRQSIDTSIRAEEKHESESEASKITKQKFNHLGTRIVYAQILD
jgi:hypothetical protein